MKSNALLFKILLINLTVFLLSSCRKSEDKPDYPAGSQENINSWILDSMKVYYYWNTSLPAKPGFSQAPGSFFKEIKNGADRFSALVNPDMPETYPPSLVHTFGFDWITLQNSDGQVQTVISLVVPGSRAEDTGLKRGDVIRTINGSIPVAGNIAALTTNSINGQVVVLELEGKTGVTTVSRLINTEEPVYTYKVFQSGGKVFGYLFLNSFENTALDKLRQAFTYFKQKQVQELILDVRYNPGGSVPVAATLAAMISPNAREGDIFVEYRGNAKAGTRKSSFAAEMNRVGAGQGMSFAAASTYRLGLNRVYILTGSHTASAAELLINALRPYIAVIQLGQQTLGKDMASFVIKDYRSPQIVPKWEIYPMIFKLYNAAGKGDYSNGLIPDLSADELSVLPLPAFGDLSDPLIQRCLPKPLSIAGGKKADAVQDVPKIIYDSRAQVDLTTPGLTVARMY